MVSAIAGGARQVQQKVQSAALAAVLGTTGDINVQGEIVQILDRQSSDIFVDVLSKSGVVSAVGSEEIEEGVVFGNGDAQDYVVLMDPLDGSSNIDVAVSIGSIFGIWKRQAGEDVTAEAMLRPGSEQVAAVYVVYGSSTVLVVATAAGVDGFTLDAATGIIRTDSPQHSFPIQVPVLQCARRLLQGLGRTDAPGGDHAA